MGTDKRHVKDMVAQKPRIRRTNTKRSQYYHTASAMRASITRAFNGTKQVKACPAQTHGRDDDKRLHASITRAFNEHKKT